MSLIDYVRREMEPLKFIEPKWVPARWVSILNETCAEFGLSLDEIRGKAKSQYVSFPRFKAMHRMREAGMSLPSIGQRLGGKDHTSVIHGLKRYPMRDVQAYLAKRSVAVRLAAK